MLADQMCFSLTSLTTADPYPVPNELLDTYPIVNSWLHSTQWSKVGSVWE